MANERSLAVGVSFLGYGDPGDGVPASIYTQCPIVHEGSVAVWGVKAIDTDNSLTASVVDLF